MQTNSDKIEIRRATFSDVSGIFSVIKENTDMLVSRSISDIVMHIDRFLVAVCNGAIIGTIAYDILPEIGDPLKTSIELQTVCIKNGFRNQGIGRNLVKTQLERVRLLDPHQIIVLTFAEPFFEKLGFKRVPKEKLMHKLYMGCINCTKHESPFTCPEQAMALTMPNNAKGKESLTLT